MNLFLFSIDTGSVHYSPGVGNLRLFRSKVAAFQLHTTKLTILLYQNIEYVLWEKYLDVFVEINIISCLNFKVVYFKSKIKYIL